MDLVVGAGHKTDRPTTFFAKGRITVKPILILMICLLPLSALGLDASDLSRYVGYYIADATTIPDEFDGCDWGDVVKLDNGWVFEFQEYNYTYTYYPDVVVLAKPMPDEYSEELRKNGIKEFQMFFYVLIIEDEAYDVIRLK